MKTHSVERQIALAKQIPGEFDSFIGVSGKFRFYIYSELLEVGETNRKTKNVIKIGKILRDCSPESSHYERVLNQCYERATKIATNEVYRLKDKNIPFSRVFISGCANIEEAKKDQNSFNYFSR